MVFSGPDPKKPCYASPAKNQVIQLRRFAEKTGSLAENGVGVVGTYLPLQDGPSQSIGFMENGVQSVERIKGQLFDQTQEQSQQQSNYVGMVQAQQAERGAAAAQVG